MAKAPAPATSHDGVSPENKSSPAEAEDILDVSEEKIEKMEELPLPNIDVPKPLVAAKDRSGSEACLISCPPGNNCCRLQI